MEETRHPPRGGFSVGRLPQGATGPWACDMSYGRQAVLGGGALGWRSRGVDPILWTVVRFLD